MRWSITWFCLLAALPALAGEKLMQQALGEWQQQIAEYKAALSLAHSEEQRRELPPPSPDDHAPKIWRSVSGVIGTQEVQAPNAAKDARGKGPKTITTKLYEFDEEWAAPAVVWLVQHPDAFAKALENKPQELPIYAQAILNSILRKHYSSPLIAEACPKLAESTSDLGFKILEKIYGQNSDPKAKSCAALALSILLANPTMTNAEGGQARTRAKRIYYIRQALNLAPEDTMFGSATLTQVAQEEIYRLRYLSAESIPPRMTLTDRNGKPAVYPQEGKANLIFFWSPAEDVGLSLMSKQGALLKQYPGLALCPIVPGGDLEELSRILEENHIDTCFMDDVQGSAGRAYRVSQLPLAVLTDERAHILYIGYPDLQLQTALNNYFHATAQKQENQSSGSARRAAPAQPPAKTIPPATQPGSSHEPPALRDMPKF